MEHKNQGSAFRTVHASPKHSEEEEEDSQIPLILFSSPPLYRPFYLLHRLPFCLTLSILVGEPPLPCALPRERERERRVCLIARRDLRCVPEYIYYIHRAAEEEAEDIPNAAAGAALTYLMGPL